MSQSKPEIALLLSTYNGERYLKQLLDSLFHQSNRSFVLFIRDDGSTDNTKGIIDSFEKKHKNIVVLESKQNYGPMTSFNCLLEFALNSNSFKYFMFVDQDDIWLPEKIQKTLSSFKEVEELQSDGIPILIHTELKVVNDNLELISKSFWKYQNLNPNRDGLNFLLMQNVITGCTVMINRALAILSVPIPSNAIMHDWWIGLVASVFGKIYYIVEPTILYRQHHTNNLGAKKYTLLNGYKKLKEKNLLLKNFKQANQFFDRYSNSINEHDKEILEAFSNLTKSGAMQKLITIFKFKFFKNGYLRNLVMLIKMMKI